MDVPGEAAQRVGPQPANCDLFRAGTAALNGFFTKHVTGLPYSRCQPLAFGGGKGLLLENDALRKRLVSLERYGHTAWVS